MWGLSCDRRLCELCSVVVGMVSFHIVLCCFLMSSTFKSHAIWYCCSWYLFLRPVMVGKSLNLHFFKNMKYYTNNKKPLGDHWFYQSFWEFCVPPSVCKVETFRCLRTTVTHIYLTRATLSDALSDSLLGLGMVSNSYMLRHLWAEITYSLHLSCHWVSVHEDILTSVLSWTSVYCVITLVFQ